MTINTYLATNQEKLDLYTTAITRVHGKNHPEAFEVRDIYTKLVAKTKAAGEAKPELEGEFKQLRELSNSYTVPDDVCETYAAVYEMLSEADTIYQNQ